MWRVPPHISPISPHGPGSQFWLTPALCGFAAIGLGAGLVAVDHKFNVTGPLPLSGTAVGARTSLNSIVTAMISLTGLVFSVTFVALQLTAGQLSSCTPGSVPAARCPLTGAGDSMRPGRSPAVDDAALSVRRIAGYHAGRNLAGRSGKRAGRCRMTARTRFPLLRNAVVPFGERIIGAAVDGGSLDAEGNRSHNLYLA